MHQRQREDVGPDLTLPPAQMSKSETNEMQQRQREDVGPDLTLSPTQMSESETSEMQQRKVGWLNILSLLHFPNSHQLLRITS